MVQVTRLERLVFPYEWLLRYDNLTHVGPVAHAHFHSRLSSKNSLSPEEYAAFRAEFYKRGIKFIMCHYAELDV